MTDPADSKDKDHRTGKEFKRLDANKPSKASISKIWSLEKKRYTNGRIISQKRTIPIIGWLHFWPELWINKIHFDDATETETNLQLLLNNKWLPLNKWLQHGKGNVKRSWLYTKRNIKRRSPDKRNSDRPKKIGQDEDIERQERHQEKERELRKAQWNGKSTKSVENRTGQSG